MKRVLFFALAILVFFCEVSFASQRARVVIFAAASLTNAVDDVIKEYNAEGGNAVASYAGSGTLAKQIENGAPADIFIFADDIWLKYLEDKKIVEKGTALNLLKNELVLISNINIKLPDNFTIIDIPSVIKNEKIIIGNPESVPAGKYAKQAFIKLGIWERLQNNLAEVENVRSALSFVSKNEAMFAVVYKTDALLDNRTKIVAEFAGNLHEAINYPTAIVKNMASLEVLRFYSFLKSNKTSDIFKKYGFKINK